MVFESIHAENLYRKREKALKMYFRKIYKYLIYQVLPKLSQSHKKDGYYELELPAGELFERVHGKMILRFYVKDDKAYFEDILPDRILTSCYEKNLPVYKGIPFDGEKDYKKLKITEKLI